MKRIEQISDIIKNKYYFAISEGEKYILKASVYTLSNEDIICNENNFDEFNIVGPIAFPDFSEYKTKKEEDFDIWAKAVESLATK